MDFFNLPPTDDGGTVTPTENSFVTVSGTDLTLNGEKFLIKSMGFGNKSQDYPTAVTTTKDYYVEGSDINRAWVSAHHSYDKNTANSYTELADMGFNTVRFSLNYNMFVDTSGNFYGIDDPDHGLGWIKTNVEAAKAAGIKLILNMHVPFGGYQSNGAGTLLWLSSDLQKKQIALFELLAKTFKDEPTIIGYSLVNEPMVAVKAEAWDDNYQDECNEALNAYTNYINSCVNAIRTHDNNHIIICERLYAVQLCGQFYTPSTEKDGGLQVVADRYVTNPTKYISIEDLRAVGYSEDGTNQTDVTNELIDKYVTIKTDKNWEPVNQYTNPGNFVKPENSTNVMYEFHNYAPMEYTHYGASWTNTSDVDYSYPYPNSKGELINKVHLESTFTNYLTYQNNYLEAPLFCGEFGVIYSKFLNDKGGEQWVADMIAIMQDKGINFSYWNYKGGNKHDLSEYGFGMYQTYEGIELGSEQRNETLYNALKTALS